MDIMIGSNVLRNTNGIVTAHGHEHVRIELGEDQASVLLTMEMYMPTGTQVAKLEKNVWTLNEGDRFELTTDPEGLKIVDTTLKNVVIELKAEKNKPLTVGQAKFYTSKGTLSEVTPEWWRVGNKMELNGIDMDLEGGVIAMPE
ncbi:MAG: hypothetical protein MRJ96_01650 [Nitrospirales bacterium]|nr:hypothetical protein [Nitrospira sp.]MDR4500148.1 hypothetical protein [Nitrospirales bacterium]